VPFCPVRTATGADEDGTTGVPEEKMGQAVPEEKIGEAVVESP
jgi:hypothetical protein